MGTDNGEWSSCPYCGVRVKSANLDSHMARMHGAPLPSEKGSPGISEKWVTAALASFIIIILLVVALSQGWLLSPPEGGSPDDGGPDDGSSGHDKSVLIELFVTPGCTACPPAEETLDKMYDKDVYNFSLVTMILDINMEAQNRAIEFNVEYVPTSVVDGGLRKKVGPKSEAEYASDISYAASQDARNITVTSSFQTSGNQLNISITVRNNNQSTFSGTVRAYVVEPESRYLASNGHAIPYGFLGYAVEAGINIPGGNEWSSYPQWTGTNINPDNIAVVIAVFGSDGRCQFAETLE